jgi:hypothetical protein
MLLKQLDKNDNSLELGNGFLERTHKSLIIEGKVDDLNS